MKNLVIVAAEKAEAVLKSIRASTLRSAAAEDGQKHKAWLIGEAVKGGGEARVIP